jgi:Zn-dependent peptidase ImmA (M78 family)
MKPTHKLYYPLDPTPTVKAADTEWWLSTDIQREVAKKGKYVSLPRIGRIANRHGLVKKTTYGFKLYHKKLVDIICNKEDDN